MFLADPPRATLVNVNAIAGRVARHGWPFAREAQTAQGNSARSATRTCTGSNRCDAERSRERTCISMPRGQLGAHLPSLRRDDPCPLPRQSARSGYWGATRDDQSRSDRLAYQTNEMRSGAAGADHHARRIDRRSGWTTAARIDGTSRPASTAITSQISLGRQRCRDCQA